MTNVELTNKKMKKLIPKLLIVLGAELLVGVTVMTSLFLYMPTKFKSDNGALTYVLEMDKKERNNYMERIPVSEKDRLMELILVYNVQKAESGDSFEKISKDKIHDATTDKQRYNLTDGSGYVIYDPVKQTMTVYDNDGQEVDPKTKLNENGAVSIEPF